MAWTTKKGFNCRSTIAFTTDNAGEVCYPDDGSLNMKAYPTSASLDGDTWNWGWSVGGGNDGCRDRSANIPSSSDHRLAGMHFNGGTLSGATLKMQIGTAPGQYKVWAGFCDQGNGSPGTISFTLRDSNGTLVSHTGLTALTSNQVYDINGNVYASGTTWAGAADGAGLAFTFTTADTSNGNGGPFLFLDMGNGSTYSVLSHFAVQFVAGSNTGITPTVGAITVNGVAPSATPIQNTLIRPFVAWKQNGKILVPNRKIILPSYKRAA